ncbi:MAG: hypothetical protein JJ978_11130 [Roseivirga sp.]|uniref:hypothetical protein n=1 Tax=Roseivirga sp. TaxID=1964215 RepID=UPI001AFCED11|nr:hypothetical protein [Roseivirga sp.]MBO6496111.1 hypothetical protein [Roseivirga sp.]
MGYSIAGFIINGPLLERKHELNSIFEFQLKDSFQVSLESALESKYETNIVDIYDSANCSILICSCDCLEECSKLGQLTLNGQKLVEFILSDVSEVFAFRFYECGIKTSEDFYVMEPEFTCYGANKLQLVESDDVIEVGLSRVVFPLTGKKFMELDRKKMVHRFNV